MAKDCIINAMLTFGIKSKAEQTPVLGLPILSCVDLANLAYLIILMHVHMYNFLGFFFFF